MIDELSNASENNTGPNVLFREVRSQLGPTLFVNFGVSNGSGLSLGEKKRLSRLHSSLMATHHCCHCQNVLVPLQSNPDDAENFYSNNKVWLTLG